MTKKTKPAKIKNRRGIQSGTVNGGLVDIAANPNPNNANMAKNSQPTKDQLTVFISTYFTLTCIKYTSPNPMIVAFINVIGDFNQIPKIFQKLYGWISQKGYKPIGPSIAVYYNIPGEVPNEQLNWELMSQLSGDIVESAPDTDGLGVKKVNAVKMATTVYKGPYENIEPVYVALNTWITANKYEIIGPVQELYFNDPTIVGEVPITEIRIPVRKR